MRILVIDIAASEGGALNILRSFRDYVAEFDRENEYILWLSDACVEPSANVSVELFPRVKASRLKRLKFDFLDAKRLVKKLKPDVIFSLQNTAVFGVGEIPQVIYMHQSIPFQRIKRFSFRRSDERSLAVVQYLVGAVIKLSLKRADHVIVQTEWIREALLESVKIPRERVTKLMPDVGRIVHRVGDGFDCGSFFYPAKREIYKNHGCLLKAAELLRSEGVDGFTVYLTADGTDDRNVVSLGSLSHDEVCERLSRSTLVFPSYIETVGLPLLEAKAVGTLILAADTPFAREVLCGYENAGFFDPFDAESLAELMRKVVKREITLKRGASVDCGVGSDSRRQIVELLCRTAEQGRKNE